MITRYQQDSNHLFVCGREPHTPPRLFQTWSDRGRPSQAKPSQASLAHLLQSWHIMTALRSVPFRFVSSRGSRFLQCYVLLIHHTVSCVYVHSRWICGFDGMLLKVFFFFHFFLSTFEMANQSDYRGEVLGGMMGCRCFGPRYNHTARTYYCT